MKKLLIPICLIAFISLPVAGYSQQYIRNTSVIDTQTAYTINRGSYQFSFWGYHNGGVELKAIIGLFDIFYCGVSFDFQNAIGKDKPRPNIPGVVAKVKLFEGWEAFPLAIGFGYDSFYTGSHVENEENPLNRMLYGPYIVVTKPIYLLNDEQHISFGVRMPVQPDYNPGDTSYFLGIDFPLGELFILKMEFERIYYDFSRHNDWLWNVGLRYSYMYQLGIEFDVMLQPKENPNRIIRIEYTDQF